MPNYEDLITTPILVHIRQYHFVGHLKFHDFSLLTVSPFDIYTSTRSTLTLFLNSFTLSTSLYLSIHSLSTSLYVIQCLHGLKLHSRIHERDQIENPTLRNNPRGSLVSCSTRATSNHFSLDHNFYNWQLRITNSYCLMKTQGRDEIPTL